MSTLVGTIIVDIQSEFPSVPAPQIALSISVICGIIVTFMGLARLGFIVDFIPLPSIAAFMTGSAITICAGQVPTLLGETISFNTRGPAYHTIVDSVRFMPNSNGYDAAMGVTALVVLYLIRAGCSYGASRYPRQAKLFFFLSSLRTAFVIIFYTMISVAVNLHRGDNPAFAIVGNVPRGLQDAGTPKLSMEVIQAFASRLPACVIVLLIEPIAISKSLGRVNNYSIDPSQELIAIGLTNILGPFVGAYSATGSFSRTAIQSKSGSRTPFAGVITAVVVLIAIYALTTVLSYTPKASLAGVIIHAVGDLITSPKTLYQFWQIAPLDVVIFVVGLVVALVNTIPNSIYATVCFSLLILLFRHAKAPGHFLGQTWTGEKGNQRLLFLPLQGTGGDGVCGSHADPHLQHPRPGVFIYRFSEGLNYPNAGHYYDSLVRTIFASTRRTNVNAYTTPGDRPWNDPSPSKDQASAELPVLRAVILDFSAVNNVDVTCIQNLVDVRNQLDRYAAPLAVQWHFANIKNRWTERALAAAGFGMHNPDTPHSISTAVSTGQPVESPVTPSSTVTESSTDDVEMGKKLESTIECAKEDTCFKTMEKTLCAHVDQKLAVQKVTRPFFHVDLISALNCVERYINETPA